MRGSFVGHDVEADDHGVRSVGQMHVGFGHSAHGGLQDANLDFRMFELGELFLNRFDRAADVRPQNDVERFDFLLPQMLEQILQRDMLRRAPKRCPAALAFATRRFPAPRRCLAARISVRPPPAPRQDR